MIYVYIHAYLWFYCNISNVYVYTCIFSIFLEVGMIHWYWFLSIVGPGSVRKGSGAWGSGGGGGLAGGGGGTGWMGIYIGVCTHEKPDKAPTEVYKTNPQNTRQSLNIQTQIQRACIKMQRRATY